MAALDRIASEAARPASGIALQTERRLLLVAATTYLVWWFAVEGILPGSYNPLASRLVIVAYFLLAFAATFTARLGRDGAERALTAGVWLLTTHYFYLVHRNPGAMPWAVGAYVVVIAAGACLRSRGAQLGYSLLCMTLAALVAASDPALMRSIFLPGLATMLVLSNVTWHNRFLLEAERAERLIADARRAAAETNVAAREEFIAVASHELYTPLTALKLSLESLSNRLGRPDATIPVEKVQERVERCRGHVERLVRLVDELLNSSRVGVAGQNLRWESVDLLELVHDVAALLATGAAVEKTPIEIDGRPGIQIWCDRFRIEQVVTNLVRNALVFGAGKPICVSVSAVAVGVRLTVSDRGIGIALQDHARIFKRFERAVSRDHYGGMGLGLYVTKQIVEAHGGQIRVESQLGQGATFIVDLPAEQRPDSSGRR